MIGTTSSRVLLYAFAVLAALGGPIGPAYSRDAQPIEVLAAFAPDGAQWNWKRPSSAVRWLDVDLVNATIEILPSDSPMVELSVAIADDKSGPSAVRLVVLETAGLYRIEDRYPPRSELAASYECLPPSGDRGDFWRYSRALTVRLFVPRGLPVSTRTMAGTSIDRR